ncbi:hypothetical protein ACE6H2_021003 [Prunus campanulata]
MMKTPEQEHPVEAFGWAARDTTGHLSPFNFSRRATGDEDVRFKVLYCGICHTDLSSIKNEWGICTYPIVPGHELVGEVTEVGSKVKKTKVGDRVGVGAVVGACHDCDNCNNDLEIYCPKMVLTYSSIYHDGTVTYGGYSDTMVANERCIVHFPDNMPLDAEPGKHVGILGLGGLGHVGVKFAKAFGAKVTVISTSPSKKDEVLKQFGADSFLVSRDHDQMQAAMGTFDGIIDTVSAVHAISPLIDLLKSHGKLIMVGAPDKPLELPVYPLLMGRKLVAGSAIGGMKETQEMIDFAAKHNITAEIEVISMDYANTAMKRLAKNDVRYRFVIDVGNTLAATKP